MWIIDLQFQSPAQQVLQQCLHWLRTKYFPSTNLDNAVFTSLATKGALADSSFKVGSSVMDVDDYIIYNSKTGALLYDEKTMVRASAQIATLNAGLTMTNVDIVVI